MTYNALSHTHKIHTYCYLFIIFSNHLKKELFVLSYKIFVRKKNLDKTPKISRSGSACPQFSHSVETFMAYIYFILLEADSIPLIWGNFFYICSGEGDLIILSLDRVKKPMID